MDQNTLPKVQSTNTKSQVYSQNVTLNAETTKTDDPKEQIELFFSLSNPCLTNKKLKIFEINLLNIPLSLSILKPTIIEKLLFVMVL